MEETEIFSQQNIDTSKPLELHSLTDSNGSPKDQPSGKINKSAELVKKLDLNAPLPSIHDQKGDGYRGIWFSLGRHTTFGDKYSGGLATYTANHNPLAVYASEVNRTCFVYGGAHNELQRSLQCMVGSYDHTTNKIQRPTIVYDKGAHGVNDPHDNPSISLDNNGYIWIFVAGRNTARDGIVLKSSQPYDINSFEEVRTLDGMTYPQPWFSSGKFLFFFTKYTNGRELYFARSADGGVWENEKKLAGFGGQGQ